jgi:hypothetical protein
MTGAALTLWLSTGDAVERSAALADLVGAGDLALICADSGETRLVRRHRDIVTRLEASGMPVLLTAAA